MEAIPQKNEWQIRHSGVVSEPMTETQMREQLSQVTVDQAWVRQGESQWVQAATIIAKLEKLERSGVYLRSRDDQEDQRTVGPFTPTRAHNLLCNKNIENLQAKIGREAPWRPASEVLKHFESILAKSKAKPDVQAKSEKQRPSKVSKPASDVKPSEQQTPSATENKSPEMKRLQVCPSCKANVNVARFANGTIIACGSCSQHFVVGEEGANHRVSQSPMVAIPAEPFPAATSAATAIPLPDPVFETVQLPAPAQSSPHRPLPSAVAVNPYSVPQQSSTFQPRRAQASSNVQYLVPGIFIASWGTLTLALALLRLLPVAILIVKLGTGHLGTQELAEAIGGFVIGTAISISMLIGGINMIRQKGLGTARTGAILAAIPCFGCFVFPFGIWASVVLFSAPAKSDFR